jgi:cytochrome c556
MVRLTTRGNNLARQKEDDGMARVWSWVSMVAIGGVIALAPALPVRASEDPIADRKANRKEVAEQAKAIKLVVDAGGPAAGVVAPAKKIVELEIAYDKMFPAGSDKGDTKALPVIWTDWKGFEAASQNMITQATLMADLGTAGKSADEIKAQFGNMGKACGGCHTTYRAK